jgi:hypothetical protein
MIAYRKHIIMVLIITILIGGSYYMGKNAIHWLFTIMFDHSHLQ